MTRDTDAPALSEERVEQLTIHCDLVLARTTDRHAETTLALIAERELMRAELRELETLLVTPGSYAQGAYAWGVWALANDVLTRIRRALGESEAADEQRKGRRR